MFDVRKPNHIVYVVIDKIPKVITPMWVGMGLLIDYVVIVVDSFLCVTCITEHFCVLTFICQVADHQPNFASRTGRLVDTIT